MSAGPPADVKQELVTAHLDYEEGFTTDQFRELDEATKDKYREATRDKLREFVFTQ